MGDTLFSNWSFIIFDFAQGSKKKKRRGNLIKNTIFKELLCYKNKMEGAGGTPDRKENKKLILF